MKKVFQRRTMVMAAVVITIIFGPSLYPLFATMPLPGFTKYSFTGWVRDTAGNGKSGVMVYLVAKGHYSLDSAFAVVQMANDFTDDVPYMQTNSVGGFQLSAAILDQTRPPDSLAVMVDVPRAFGKFVSMHDTVGVAATEKALEQNSGGCSCAPTSSIVTYQGTEYDWHGYVVTVR